MSVAVLVDSSSDLDLVQAESYGIDLLLLSIHFAGRDWLDHLELNAEEMFGILKVKPDIPAPYLRVPKIEHYLTTVERLLETHDHVFALHTSPLIGKVYSMAFRASQALPGRLSVMNSGTASGGIALQAIRARQLFDAGQSVQQVSGILQSVYPQQQTRICVTTLDGFKRAKIISSARAFIGERRNLKPILAEQKGRLEVLTTPQGHAAAEERMLQEFRDCVTNLQDAQVIFGYSGNLNKLARFRDLARELGVHEVLDVRFGAVLSSIAGPDAYGFSLEPRQV